jgi:hypothetical protein
MVRAFTISFEFEGKIYLGWASLKPEENETLCCVRIYDDVLARIVPERELTYNRRKPLCPSSLRHPNALRLFTVINESVNEHLHAAKI